MKRPYLPVSLSSQLPIAGLYVRIHRSEGNEPDPSVFWVLALTIIKSLALLSFLCATCARDPIPTGLLPFGIALRTTVSR